MSDSDTEYIDRTEIRVTLDEDDQPTLVLPSGQEITLWTFVKVAGEEWMDQIRMEKEIMTDEGSWWTLYNHDEEIEVVIQPEVEVRE